MCKENFSFSILYFLQLFYTQIKNMEHRAIFCFKFQFVMFAFQPVWCRVLVSKQKITKIINVLLVQRIECLLKKRRRRKKHSPPSNTISEPLAQHLFSLLCKYFTIRLKGCSTAYCLRQSNEQTFLFNIRRRL